MKGILVAPRRACRKLWWSWIATDKVAAWQSPSDGSYEGTSAAATLSVAIHDRTDAEPAAHRRAALAGAGRPVLLSGARSRPLRARRDSRYELAHPSAKHAACTDPCDDVLLPCSRVRQDDVVARG